MFVIFIYAYFKLFIIYIIDSKNVAPDSDPDIKSLDHALPTELTVTWS